MSHKKQNYKVNHEPIKEEITYEFPVKPEPITLTKFIYNSSEGSFFGRTPKNWGQLGLFYLIFYIVLAAFCAICMQGLLATLNDDYPKWQLDRSIIGTNPGMSFRPVLNVTDRGEVIQYEASSKKAVKQWVNAMNEFLQIYTNASTPTKTKRVTCTYDSPPKANEVCKFELSQIQGDCGNNATFGFNTSVPCVFLKLNKIYGWVPDYYNNQAELNPNMPEELVKHIKSINNTLELNQIWVSCKGRKNDTVRDIQFMGSHGFPGYYYPYTNLEGYQSPLVPIQIRLEPNIIEEGRLVEIECRVWAKNILYSSSLRNREGSVLISVLIEK